jgi:hypothetical protein
MKNFLVTLFSVAFIIATNSAFGQCKTFAKKKCLPQLESYTHDGKMNIATVWPGDKAELLMTFYANTPYRLLVCLQDKVKPVFKVKDQDNNIIYESKPDGKDYLDFKVAATQQLIVEIVVPEKANKGSEIEYESCLCVFVGLK